MFPTNIAVDVVIVTVMVVVVVVGSCCMRGRWDGHRGCLVIVMISYGYETQELFNSRLAVLTRVWLF